MGRCNNRRVQQVAQASRNTPSRARFSKGPPNRKRNNNKKSSGRGGGGGGRGGGPPQNNKKQQQQQSTATTRKFKNNVVPSASASVINKLSHRVRQETNGQRHVNDDDPFKNVDISHLDEITLSESSIQLVTKLLTDLNVMEAKQQRSSSTTTITERGRPTAQNDNDDDDDEHDVSRVEEANVFEERQQHREYFFENNIGTCTATTTATCGYVEYENDVIENDDDDDDDDEYQRGEDNNTSSSTITNVLSVVDETQQQQQQQDNVEERNKNVDHDSDDVTKSPIFLHLTTQLSFSEASVDRACRAIEQWKTTTTVSSTSSSNNNSNNITTTKRNGSSHGAAASDTLDSDQLALAMDWLCLHLTDDELRVGFRPNAAGRRVPTSTTSGEPTTRDEQTSTRMTRPIPHSSIYVAKPITSDREWFDSMNKQSRMLNFVRLGFSHNEAEQACDETAHVVMKENELDDEDGLRLLLILLERNTLGNDIIIEEPSNPTDFDYCSLERKHEIEALEAIFDGHFEVIRCQAAEEERPGHDRYLLTVTPVEDLGHNKDDDECRLHVFVRPGYPVLSPPLLLFSNPTLPPTLLRRINVSLIRHAHENIGEPVLFSAMDFLANTICQMQTDFIKEQRALEMQAKQLQMRREAGHNVDNDVDDLDLQLDTDGKVGRRQKARRRAAEKAFQSSEQIQEKEEERRRREEERLERIRCEEQSLRQTMANRAIEQREKERIEEEAERAARSAMNAAFNRGENIDEARAAAKKARKESLRHNGEEVCSSDEEDGVSSAQVDETVPIGPCLSQEATQTHAANEDAITAGSSKLLDETQSDFPSNATPSTMAFMERLRKCYNDAVREKIRLEEAKTSVIQRNGEREMESVDRIQEGHYHFADPHQADDDKTKGTESNEHAPTPVPFPTGDLADIMKDVIRSQNEQPWLISSEARVPTVNKDEAEITDELRCERSEISKNLKEELVGKHKAADSWAQNNSSRSNTNSTGGKPQQFHKMRSQRQRLPAYMTKGKIVSTIKSNQVTVISADTGAGKTTQVPQLVLDDMIMSGLGAEANMIVTQPRRISAIGVSERIAAERCERLGETVGYSIRLENKRSAKTRLLLCTTGILLRRLQCDPDLAAVSHVFVDEVHERDLNTDFLLIVLKGLLARRKSLKLILMSATLNAAAFSDYFGGCPVVSIPGRAFPVTENRLEDILQLTGFEVQEDSDYALKPNASRPARFSKSALRRMYYPKYRSNVISSLAIIDETVINYELIAELVEHICLNNDEGAILIFMPGMMEITKAIEELYKKELFQSSKTVVYPLHSSLSTSEQTAIFEVPPEGVRKIVVATNIAETSITIEDVVYVVDAGRVKENRKDEANEMPTLVETWVSRASAKQRRGRAGRVREGISYHMFSSHTYEHDLEDYQLPEMLRVGLEDLVLQILLLDLGEPCTFLAKAVNPPSAMAMRNSLKLLEGLGAVEVQWQARETLKFSDASISEKDSASCGAVSAESDLTALGFHLATLPVDPRVGKMMIYGAMFQITDPALTIAASLSARSPFVSPFDQREEADAARKEFALEGSDHLTTLNAFNTWKDMRRTKRPKATKDFLQENFLSQRTLFQMEDLRRQFADLLKDVGFLPRDYRHVGGSSERRRDFNNPGVEIPRSSANAYSDNMALVKAILCAGMYPNIIVAPRCLVRATNGGGSTTTSDSKSAGECAFQSLRGGEVYLHPCTISFSERRLDSRYCCYHDIVRTSKTYVRDCTTVSEFALLLFGGSLKVYHSHGVVTVDDWLQFRISPKAAALVKHLRTQMEGMLLKKILSPSQDITGSNESRALIQAVSVLLYESEVLQINNNRVRPWMGTTENDERRGDNNNNRRVKNGSRRTSRGNDSDGRDSRRQGNNHNRTEGDSRGGTGGRRGGRGRGRR